MTKQAAIFVNKGSSVVFDSVDGFADADAKLTVQGGYGGVGIGGCRDHSTGTITIDGGTIHAAGGRYASGIGGGFYKGTSYEMPGRVVINGGRIVAIGYNSSPGIGMGYSYSKGLGYDVRITGGTVTATGGYGRPAIGAGKGGTSPGTITFGTDSSWLVKAGDNAGAASEVAYAAFAANHTQHYVFIKPQELAPTQPKIASIKLTTTAEGAPQVEVKFAAEGRGTYALKRSVDLTVPIADWEVIDTVTGSGENLLLARSRTARRQGVLHGGNQQVRGGHERSGVF